MFPDVKNVSRECGGEKDNHTSCCDSMKSYLSHLQEQSFITNLQALECAEFLARKLQKANVTNDVFSLCHVNLKDFSLQGQYSLVSIKSAMVLVHSSNHFSIFIGFLFYGGIMESIHGMLQRIQKVMPVNASEKVLSTLACLFSFNYINPCL